MSKSEHILSSLSPHAALIRTPRACMYNTRLYASRHSVCRRLLSIGVLFFVLHYSGIFKDLAVDLLLHSYT